ncbi:MAG: epoxide hydrolase [Proteobacteria bacterium]|nr:epoxide hydrolase [Pseudomonadota bacterium]HQR02761.1 epoxide hydrolase [Rhodocyclaceae bacterium]
MAAAERFSIHVSDDELEDLRRRLSNTRFAPDFGNSSWSYGTEREYLESLVGYWLNHYQWRTHEAEMNRYPHYRVEIEGVPIHYIHLKSSHPGAIPLIMTHGWPWTFWDFNRVIAPLADPQSHGGKATDAFDIVIPSLPGYAFSSPLRQTGISAIRTADLWHRLMTEILGYPNYAAHGGDWGAYVTAQLGHQYPEHLLGIHMIGGAPLDWSVKPLPGPDDYAADEHGWHERTHRFFLEHQGYFSQQATRPQTLAYGLSDSPVGLCAWLLEKRRSWSDSQGNVESRFSKDDLLTSVMLYWVTNTIGTSIRMYYESRNHPWQPVRGGEKMVTVPTGVLRLEHDVVQFPRAWMEKCFDIRRWTRSDVGGHFAPFEEPQLVVDELRQFFSPLRTA